MARWLYGRTMTTLRDLLHQNKAAITDKWLGEILGTYPSRTTAFFKRKKDPFANPVGQTLARSTEAIFDGLLEGLEAPTGMPVDALCTHLDEILKVRSIQDFTPSQALSFVFQLKDAIREELEPELGDPEIAIELTKFERQIDQLALFSFDILVKCREKLYELRVNEIKRTGFRLLRKANLIAEDPGIEPEPASSLSDV